MQATPVPGVVVRPDAAPPVERAHTVGLIEFPFFIAAFYDAFRAHAVDFLIEIEVSVFVKRSRDYHRFFWEIGKRDVESQSVVAVELGVSAFKMADFAVVFKGIRTFALRPFGRAFFRRFGKVHLAEREHDKRGFRNVVRFVEFKNRRGQCACKAVVADSERKPVMLIADVVIIPFLNAPVFGFDVGAVIFVKHLFGKAGLFDIAVFVKQSLGFRDLVLHNSSEHIRFDIIDNNMIRL